MGWMKRRSTRTTKVFACLSLTTTPWSVRFGILIPSTLRRGQLRRTLTLGPRDRLQSRDVAPDFAHTRGIFQLTAGTLEAQVEVLLLELEHFVVDLIDRHRSDIGRFHVTRLLADPLDETSLDRQFGGGQRQRLFGDVDGDTVDLEQNAARFYARDPELGRALAGAHADFERLLRHRHVRKQANPDAAGALHMPGERTARRLDLARGDPLGLESLEAILTERQADRARCDAVDAPFVRLAKFRPHRLQHGFKPLSQYARSRRVPPRPADIALGHLLVLRHRVVLHDLALEDPNLHATGAVSGERGSDPVIDVGAQRMQRHAALAVPFHARDFGAAEPTRAIDADAAGAEPHRRLHGALHRAAECDAAFELLRDRFGDQLSVEFGFADFHDIDHDIAVGEGGDLAAQFLDVGALLADDDAGTRRVDGDAAFLVRPLDHDLGHRGLFELRHQHLADFHILVQQRAITRLAGIPARIPGAVDAETQPDRIDLLTHGALLAAPVTPAPRLRAPRW